MKYNEKPYEDGGHKVVNGQYWAEMTASSFNELCDKWKLLLDHYGKTAFSPPHMTCYADRDDMELPKGFEHFMTLGALIEKLPEFVPLREFTRDEYFHYERNGPLMAYGFDAYLNGCLIFCDIGFENDEFNINWAYITDEFEDRWPESRRCAFTVEENEELRKLLED